MSTLSSRIALETSIWLIEDAFEGDPLHSLIVNLQGVREDDWTAMPVGSGRSIADILEHVGWSKWMYEDYAFGSASMRGDHPPLIPEGDSRSRPSGDLLAWLKEGHRRWLGSVRAPADDSEPDRERLTNWGQRLPTPTISITLARSTNCAPCFSPQMAGLTNRSRSAAQRNLAESLWYPRPDESHCVHP